MEQILLIKVIKKTTAHIRRWILFTCLLSTNIYTFAAQQPVIISSATSHYQQSLVQSILIHLKESEIQATTIDIDQQPVPDTSNELIISIGDKASMLVNQENLSAPRLSVYTQIDPDKDQDQKNTIHLSMTQHACQQFELTRSLNSKWKNVSVLLSNQNTALIKKLESCAAQYNLALRTILLSQYVSIIDALNTSLLNSDILLALPDSDVYNARTIKGILLTTYRHKVPVIGFSESFVRAGALAAIHTSTEQLGKQIADIIIKHYNNGHIETRHLFPAYFDISINKDVAKSLGIITPDRKALIEKMNHKNNE
ncbi:MAG: hypothetical protein OEY66_05545 [Gammaproteobacteria bacterium]|nr:hypothetical protein [Gammaproteobacteria bacterium]